MTQETKSSRRVVYVMNPAAGRGKYLPKAHRAAEEARADVVHLTEHAGECADFIADACLRDPDTHFVVFGGDGTAGEAAEGIMRAGAGSRALLTLMPAGSGNDFVRGIREFPLPEGEDAFWIDLISVNGRYVLNMINIGFDCDTVVASERVRRSGKLSGKLSYILGAGSVLMHKKAFPAKIRLLGVEKEDGSLAEEELDGEFLLCAAANLPYCGGGFKAAPGARPADGLMDIMMIRDMSRAHFLSLVGGYRKGKHVNPETGNPYPQYRSVAEYRRCRTLCMESPGKICLDGEVIPAAAIRADIVPKALRITMPGKF